MRWPLVMIVWLLGMRLLLAQVVGPAAELQPQVAPLSPDSVMPVYVAPYPSDAFPQGPPLVAPYADPVHMPNGLPVTEPPRSPVGGPPPGARKGLFQSFEIGGAWSPQFEDDGLGLSQIRTSVLLGLPFPDRESPLLIKPQYTINYLDGPNFVDVPARLHEAELELQHFRPLTDRWMLNAAFTVGEYADDDSFGDSEALRFSGRLLGIYQANDEWKWIVGVVYLNRPGLSVVPALGWIYKTPDTQLDIVFPRPRFARLLTRQGEPGFDERWWYVQGEYGGGIWAVRRADGSPDVLNSADLRVSVGIDRKLVGGLSRRWELGYIFARELEYESNVGDIEVDDTVVARLTLTY